MRRSVLLGLSILLLTIAPSALSQDRIRLLEEYRPVVPYRLAAPIEIVRKNFDATRSGVRREEMTGPDWLRGLELTVKNVSQKPITRFQITMAIKKQERMMGDFAVDYNFPPLREPILDREGKPTGSFHPLKVLKPGETITLGLSNNHLRTLDNLNDAGITDLQHVVIRLETIFANSPV